MSFNLDDYIDVNARIALMKAQHPDMSLQSDVHPLFEDGKLIGWQAKAYAYRSPADERPGVGHAFEPVPGKTPYTKDSEAMNAETSAWGRAIVALGFETKKIASSNEMITRVQAASEKARQTQEPPPAVAVAADEFEGTYVIDAVFGPNTAGFYDVKTTSGEKFSTKDAAVVAGVEKGATVLMTGKTTVKGQYTNHYIKTLHVLPAGATLDDDGIPF